MNWFDVVIALLVLGSVFGGLRSGLARVVVGLCAMVAGLLAAFWLYRMLALKLLPYVNENAGLANVLAFLVILFSVLLLGSAVSALLSRLLQWVGLSWFNHALGGIAGFARGVLLVAVIADALIAFAPSPVPGFLNESRLLPYATPLAGWLADAAPRELRDAFDAQLQNMRHLSKGSGQKVNQI